MAVYSVLEPPRRVDGRAVETDRFAFVPDKFNWAAFLFGPLWMLRYRLWLVLVGYLVIMAGFEVTYRVLGAPDGARHLVMLLAAILLGLEAATLRRWTLLRAGWHDHGIVVADDLEAAEQRFFGAWTAAVAPAAHSLVTPLAASEPRTMPVGGTGIIGLFPRPGTAR